MTARTLAGLLSIGATMFARAVLAEGSEAVPPPADGAPAAAPPGASTPAETPTPKPPDAAPAPSPVVPPQATNVGWQSVLAVEGPNPWDRTRQTEPMWA